jgi:hypothetical protein
LIEDGVILYGIASPLELALFFEVLNSINFHLTPDECVPRKYGNSMLHVKRRGKSRIWAK